MAILQERSNGAWHTVFELAKPETIRLGRDSQNDIVLRDPHCSRCQAEIYFDEGKWTVRDVGSHNGTQVSGYLITGPHVFQNGDVMRVGEIEFLFSETDAGVRDVGSVSAWVKNLQDASKAERAQFELWERYCKRLLRLARHKLGDLPRRVADEEDAVSDAFESFLRGVQDGCFPRLDNRDDLWNILATITARKVCRQIEQAMAKKRGGGQVAGESVFGGPSDSEPRGLDNVVLEQSDDELLVEFRDTWSQYLTALPDAMSRQIAKLRLAGIANCEIADRIEVSVSTVERRLRSIRAIWDQRFCYED